MARKDLKVRIRPQRVAVLVQSRLGWPKLRNAFAFLSMLWGGRYCPIIPISSANRSTALQRLSRIRPEIVCGLGINHRRWKALVEECCQPRAYAEFPKKWRKLIQPAGRLDLITAFAPLNRIVKSNPTIESSRVRLVPDMAPARFQPYFDAVFGIHDPEAVPWLENVLKAQEIELSAASGFAQFVDACISMSDNWSWLDLGSERLDKLVIRGDGLSAPTVILVHSVAQDLSLFWCLRMQSGIGASNRFLPVPIRDAESDDSLNAVVTWIKSSGVDSNYCQVTTESVPPEMAQRIARRLRARLRGTDYRYVDFVPAADLWPTVVPFQVEKPAALVASLENHVLSCELPAPEFASGQNTSDCWMVDIDADAVSKRAIGELCLPARKPFVEFLKASTPPTFSIGGMERVG